MLAQTAQMMKRVRKLEKHVFYYFSIRSCSEVNLNGRNSRNVTINKKVDTIVTKLLALIDELHGWHGRDRAGEALKGGRRLRFVLPFYTQTLS